MSNIMREEEALKNHKVHVNIDKNKGGKNMLPTDPMMLLSYVNTQLRDFYPDLTSFCKDNGLDQEEICKKLRSIDYEYDLELNKFV